MKKFAGSIAVITGAGSGIGRAVAKALAQKGSKVHVVDVDVRRARETVEQIRLLGGSAVPHEVDCRSFDELSALAADVVAEDGRVDILHNNAGVGHAGAIEETSLEDWSRVLSINLWGVINGIQAFLPQLLKQSGESHIVNTASGLGLIAAPGLAPYVTSKFAVVGLSEALAAELKPRGIYVTAICPGIVHTNVVKDARLSGRISSKQASAERMYGRFGATPERVAKDVVRAIEARRVVQVSPPTQMYGPWLLKRFFPSVYQFFAGQFGRRLLSEG